MKQGLLFLSIIALAFVGCKKDPNKGPEQLEGIVLDGQLEGLTKYDGATFETGDEISFYATNAGVALAVADNFIQNSKYVRGDNGFFVKENGKDGFPAMGGIDIYALYPYLSAGIASLDAQVVNCSVDQSSSEKLLTNDVVYAVKTGIAATLQPIGLSFEHVMSKIVVNAKTAADFGDVKIASVKLKLKNEATLNLVTKTVTVGGNVVDITPMTVDGENGVKIATAIVPAQEVSAGVSFIEVTLTNGKTYEVGDSKNLNIEQGKVVTVDVTATLGGDKAILVNGTVTDWNKVTTENVTVIEKLRTAFVGTTTEASIADYTKAYVTVKNGTRETTFELDATVDQDAKKVYFEFRGSNNVPNAFPYEITSIALDATRFTVANGAGITDESIKNFTFNASTITF